MIHYSLKIFLPSEIRIMNRHGSDKPHVCHNALQTSLIREHIRRRISSTINCEIQNLGAKLQKKSQFRASILSKILQTNRFLSMNQLRF